jgi:hypothetical protein
MRDATNKILEMIDEGLLDARAVAQMCLKYMSEDDVAYMAEANEIFFEDNEDFEEDDYEEEEPECPYVVFAGKSCDEENPMSAWLTEESAIEAGKAILASKSIFYKYVEVVLMPEDDIDTNEVIWWGENVDTTNVD